MIGSPRPLPDSLTRLLKAEPGSTVVPTPGDRVRRVEPAALSRAEDHGALEDRVLRGVVIALTGLVWIAILWLVLRHFIPQRIV